MFSKKLNFIALLCCFLFAFKGNKPVYKIFNELGKKTSYSKIIKATENADIVFFGELHDNPIDHWLELQITKDIFSEVNDNLILGAEMFEADNQVVINEYLGGHYDYKTLKEEAKLWPNNKTDYQPLLDFALTNQLSFIATNVPRRYAHMVYKNDFKALKNITPEAKKWIAPLPIKYDKTLPGYSKMLSMGDGHGGENLPKVQALKDATMAYFILKNWKKGQTFIHFNGAYHTNDFDGIIWYLKQQNSDLTKTY